MKSKNVLNLFKFVELLVNARIAYNNVKDDPEVAKTTKTFGKRSLVYYFVFLLLGAITGGLIYFFITNFLSSLIILSVFAIVAAVYTGIYAIGMFILSFNLAIKQVKLNKHPLGIIALVLNIIVLVAVLLGILLLIFVIGVSK
ncbi:MAG: hypothetical protein E7351_02725 [Clostridiales bacterium]|nr:hypothetical protein [Clostridiales bacterium]